MALKPELVSLFTRDPRRRDAPIALSSTEQLRLEQRIRVARMGKRGWITFNGLGDSGSSLLTRLVLLWMIGLPLLMARAVMAVALFWFTMGFIQLASSSALVGGGIVFQYTYRDVMHFASSNPAFQNAWDVMATAMSLTLSIFVWTIRLVVEIHNGMCPLYALLADVLLLLAQQLALVWYAAPLLQYFISWIIRFATYLIEPALDCLITVFETFMYLVTEASDVIAEGAENAASGVEDSGEMLLKVVVIVCTVMLRILQALLIVFAPLLYGLLRVVVPIVLGLMPAFVDLVSHISNIVTSSAGKRIIFFLLESLPIAIEAIGQIVCDLGLYLGSGFCYLLYGVCTVLSFFLKYVIRPVVCGSVPLVAGCLESFVGSLINGESCYACNGYNTNCGCKHNVHPRMSTAPERRDCDGDVCSKDGEAWTDIPVPMSQDDSPAAMRQGDQGARTMHTRVSDAVDPASTTWTGVNDGGRVSEFDLEAVEPVTGKRPAAAQSTIIELQQTASIWGSPNFYAPLSEAYDSASRYTWGSMPMRSIATGQLSICQFGVGADCTAERVEADIRHIKTRGAHMLSVRGGSWQPVTWFDGSEISTAPWLHVQLSSQSNLTSIQMEWASRGNTVLGPTSVLVQTDTGQSFQFDGLSCTPRARGEHRNDVLIFRADVSWLRLQFTSPCTSQVTEHTPAVSLQKLLIRGTALSEPRLARLSSLTINPVLSNVSLFDACGTGTLDAVLIGSRLPVVLIESPSDGHVGLVIAATQATFEAEFVIVRFAGTSRVRRSAIWLCMNQTGPTTRPVAGCISPEASDSTAESPLRDFRRQQLQQVTGDGIFTDSYYSEVGNDPGFHASLVFKLDKARYENLVIWIDDFDDNRCITWDTVLVETGMHPDLHINGRTISTISSLMTSDTVLAGRVRPSNAVFLPDACDAQSRLATRPDNVAVYATPLQGRECARSIAIAEIAVFGENIVEPQRRTAEATMEQSLRGRSTSWERRSELQRTSSLSAVMAHHKSNSFGDAPQNARHHPFTMDIRLMPDPLTEPRLRCTRDGAAMTCTEQGSLFLRAPQNESAKSRDVANRDISEFHLASVTKMQTSLDAQREVSNNARRRLEAMRMFPVDPPAPNSRRLQGAGFSFNAIVDAVVDTVTEKIPDMLEDLFPDILRSILQCRDGETIGECLLRPVLDLLMWLFMSLLKALDALSVLLLSALTIKQETVSIGACLSCSFTTIAVGVLADFADGFSLDTCSDIIDHGADACRLVGVDTGPPGSAVFSSIWGLLKISIGAIQIMPAVVEVTFALCEVAIGTAIHLFPQLLGDGIEVFAFFIASSSAVAKLEVLFQALVDPVLDGVDDLFGLEMKQASSSPVTPSGVGSTGSPLAGTACSGVVDASRCRNASAAARIVGSGPDAVGANSELTYGDLGGCGCVIEPTPCQGGIGTGDCSVTEGRYSARLRTELDSWEQTPSRRSSDECESYPECAPRVVGADIQDSGEMVTTCMHEHRCRMLVRAPLPPSTNTEEDFGNTFTAFSRREGLNVKGSATPGRRRCPAGQPQGGMFADNCRPEYSRYMKSGRRLLFDTDEPSGYVPRARTMYVATRGFRAMMDAGNQSYAQAQVRGLRADILSIVALATNVSAQVHKRWPTRARFDDTLDHSLGNVRRILGVSESAKRIGCGWAKDTIGSVPNTYPCCKGLWCVDTA
jgi:hypothetical protein